METSLSELISRPALSVDRTATLRVVIDQLTEHGASFTVVGDSHSVAGVVSALDVLTAIHRGADIDEIWAADVMSEDVIAVDADSTLQAAAKAMTESRVRQLLVLGDQGGVVSILDLLAAVIDQDS